MYANFRTGYSFRHAVGKVSDVIISADVANAFKQNYYYAPIADRGSCYGWSEWGEECEKQGLIPIYGVELAVCTEEDLFEAAKPARDYWIFYATELKYLNNILSVATSQSKHIFKGGKNLRTPILSYNQAMRISYQHVYKICSYRANVDEICDFLEKNPQYKTNLYAGFSQAMTYGQFFYLRSILELPFVLVSENKYPAKEDIALYQNVCGNGAITKLIPQHILNMEELYDNLKFKLPTFASFTHECYKNTRCIFETCRYLRIKSGGIPKAQRKKSLREECFDNLYSSELSKDKKYLTRLNKELALIEKKEFTFYFELVADICQWARKKMLVGPGRGSAAGSLVCYLMGITSIDPIKYKLSFERFLTEYRVDLPDIDIDFPNRDMVITYLKETFGKHNVAKLGTVNMYQARSALREAAGAMGIPQYHVTKTIDGLIEYPAGSEKQKQALTETLNTTKAGKQLLMNFPEFVITKRIEDHPRHAGVHAAGVIVSERPIAEIGPVDNHGDETVLMLDKKAAEWNNLLKIDALGLHQLAIIENCLEVINIQNTSLPDEYNDELCFDILRRGAYGGIFQFEGTALQSVCDKIYLEDFEDMAIVTSIARRGPLSSGAARDWIKRKNSHSDVYTKIHPILDEILEPTQGVLVFQEQVMDICRKFARMDWLSVMGIREAIGKSKGKEAIDKFGQLFKTNLELSQTELGINNEFINKLWNEILQHGGYSFNRSHAICYSVISYWCLWLKVYYPKEFIASTLTYTKDEDKKRNLLIEATTKLGIDYKAVDEETSLAIKWKVNKLGVIVGPFINIHGIGIKLANQIIGARNRNDDIKVSLLKKIRNNKIPLASLHMIHQKAKKLCGGDFKKKGIVTKITNVDDIRIGEQDMKYTIICTPVSLKVRNMNEQKLIEKRKGKIIPSTQPLEFLSGYVKDDTGKILVNINRFNYSKPYAKQFFESAKADRSLFALRGLVRGGEGKTYKSFEIENFKYLGEM